MLIKIRFLLVFFLIIAAISFANEPNLSELFGNMDNQPTSTHCFKE